jgi:broad specificity phosphatase PhoE
MHIFREVERPASLSGTSYFHIRTLWYVSQLVMHRNNARWRYDDAENFTDIYTRVRTAFAFLESLTEEHKSIIIVSHSEFINLMIMYMCHDRVLTLTDIVKTSLKINELKNCDVTHVEYVGPTLGNTCAWQLVTT